MFFTTLLVALVATTGAAAVGPKKRGVCYNNGTYTNSFVASGSQVSWQYNWGSTSGGGNPKFEYVPMIWGPTGTFADWEDDVDAAVASGSQHILSFNEPDSTYGANLSPADAAAGYMKFMQPFAGTVKLGGPAITAGGLTWLGEFYGNCTACTIDFQPVHWYDYTWNLGWFKIFLDEAYTISGQRNLWLTEFAGFGTDDEIITFIETVMPWMDQQSWIERYAYFGAFDDILMSITGTDESVRLSKLGWEFKRFYNSTVSSVMES